MCAAVQDAQSNTVTKSGCTVIVSRLPSTSPALSGGCCSAKWYPSCVAKRADPKSATCRDKGITVVTVSSKRPSDNSAGHARCACALPYCYLANIVAVGSWLCMDFSSIEIACVQQHETLTWLVTGKQGQGLAAAKASCNHSSVLNQSCLDHAAGKVSELSAEGVQHTRIRHTLCAEQTRLVLCFVWEALKYEQAHTYTP